ncbi:MAG: DUF748 domain-containing protein, partial [Kangiellaceae bacterium]|nr:DUF748 domain-containing protein [Kangiellaceae bacterium]
MTKLALLKKHYIITFISFFTVVIALLLAFSSQIAVSLAKSYFADYSDEVVIDQVSLNWWDSSLTIGKLKVSAGANQTIAVKNLRVVIEYLALLNTQLVVDSLTVSELQLDITTDQLSPSYIGPIPISKNAEQALNEKPEPWSIVIRRAMLRNLRYCLSDKSMSYFELSIPLKQNAPIDICMNIGKVTLNEPLRYSHDKKLSSQGSIELTDIDLNLNNSIKLLDVARLGFGPSEISSHQFEIDGIQLNRFALFPPKDVKTAELALSVENAEVTKLNHNTDQQLTTLSDLVVSDLILHTQASSNQLSKLLSLSMLEIPLIKFAPASLAMDRLSVRQVSLLEDLLHPGTDHMSLASLTVSSLQHAQQATRLGDIVVEQAKLTSRLTRQGIDLLSWFPPQASAESSSQQGNLKRLAISSLSVGSNSQLVLIDQTKPAHVVHSFQDIIIDANDIEINASKTPTSPNVVAFSMSYQPLGNITGKALINWSRNLNSLDLKGQIKKLDLVNFTHYVAASTNYRVNQGLLNIDYNIKLKQNKLAVTLNTRLDKLELDALQDHERSELNDSLGIPLPMALDLLRDSDDRIDLDLSTNGDLSDPQFSVSGIVSVVVMK